MKVIITLGLALSLLACKSSGPKNDKAVVQTIQVALESKSDSKVAGTATFSQDASGKVTLTASMTGLEPGIHAIHIHEKSDCSDPKAESAGGHWNPTRKKHGKWGEAEHHAGDIGNFPADENGNGAVVFSTSEWCIGCGDATKDILGKGLIVHAKADDYITQPTGNAGGRVACAGLIK